MDVWVGALGRYGPLGQLWSVWATFVAKNNICCYLKKETQKRVFFGLIGPGCAWWVHIRFGVKFVWNPLRC